MKLTGRDASGFLRKPDTTRAGILIFGADPVRVATARSDVVSALVGAKGESEMRLTRMAASDLRKDTALLNDALKAQGFFPGHRVVCVDDATDGLSKVFDMALNDWREGDAQIVATAGQLTAKSPVRKSFEGHRNAVAIGLYDDPPGRDEIDALVAAAGLTITDSDVQEALTVLSTMLSAGDFRQTIDKLGLYKLNDAVPLSVQDIQLSAPASSDVGADHILDVVCSGRTDLIGTTLRELYAQGVGPTTLCINAMRHFRQLHVVASDPGGTGQGIAKLRPPVFGPRRDKMVRQASNWGRDRIERAMTALADTDLILRSSSKAPQSAIMERTLIRLSMMAGR